MVIIMALMTAPLSVFATTTKKIVKSGFCGVKGDSVKYTLYNDGTLVISGQGKMKDFAFSKADGIIVPYADNSYNKKYGLVDNTVKNVVIKNGITRIGNEAFAYFIGLKSVSIPNSVTGMTKGKTYYFKVKAYVAPDSKTTIYGDYSSVKYAKIK